LLETSVFAFESEKALNVALQLFADGGANFADCLHLALAAQADALPLLTFDQDAAKRTGAALAG
jgi:predicted nucleic-acid-binding protein